MLSPTVYVERGTSKNFLGKNFTASNSFSLLFFILIFSTSSRQCCISSSLQSSLSLFNLQSTGSPFPSCAPLCEPSCDDGCTPACGAPAVRRWRHAGLGAASPASSWRKLLRQRHSRCSGSGYFRPGDVRCGRSHGVDACSACSKSGRQSPVEP